VNESAEVATHDTRIATLFTDLALAATPAILRFDCRNVTASLKADESPVTAADKASEEVILQGLAAALPGVPVVSEESVEAWTARSPGRDYVLVDPLDGTREFLAGNGEYTINIALVRDGIPVVGVVAAPALGLVWRGAAGHAQRLRLAPAGGLDQPVAIRARAWPASGRAAAVSRSHFEPASAAFLQRFAPIEPVSCGSALKFCRVAEGTIDVYPRLAPTSEWDVAAGHALVVAAGGAVMAPDGGALAYGRGAEGFRVPGFVAWGDAAMARKT
jgi:3'(2'), 5'-bisphosphate nucleotidase